MSSKAAVIVLSDPQAGSEESLGRLFNALAAVYDFKQRGGDVQLLFQGAGTRWAGELVNKEHPAYELFQAVKDKTAGVSCGCADVLGARDGAETCGLDLNNRKRRPDDDQLAEPRPSDSGRLLHTDFLETSRSLTRAAFA